MTAARKFLGQVLGIVLLGTVIAGALALIVVPKATGARPLTVLSGSMAPAFDAGDVVIVKPGDHDNLQIGDVITFQAESNNPELTTHRISGVVLTNGGREYVTRGDANGASDLSPIKPEQIRGEVWYSVPKVGHLSVWANAGALRTALDIGALLLVIYGGYLLLGGMLDRRKRKAVPA